MSAKYTASLCIAGCILGAALLLKHHLGRSNKVSGSHSSDVIPVILPDLPRLPEFCHATIHNGLLHISGCIGLQANEMRIVSGGIKNEIVAALGCVAEIMEYAAIHHGEHISRKPKLIKVNVYLKDNSKERFFELNEGYAEFFRQHNLPFPARITVGCGTLALGAQVEIDAVAAFS